MRFRLHCVGLIQMFRRWRASLGRRTTLWEHAPSRRQLAFRARQGLGHNTDETLAEVGRQMARTRRRIRQFRARVSRRRRGNPE